MKMERVLNVPYGTKTARPKKTVNWISKRKKDDRADQGHKKLDFVKKKR